MAFHEMPALYTNMINNTTNVEIHIPKIINQTIATIFSTFAASQKKSCNFWHGII